MRGNRGGGDDLPAGYSIATVTEDAPGAMQRESIMKWISPPTAPPPAPER